MIGVQKAKGGLGMRRARQIKTAAYHILMLAFSFGMVYPLLWMAAASFKPNTEIFTNANSLIPLQFTTEHYTTGWRGFAGLSFAVFFKNSIFVALLATAGVVLSSSFAAFGLARLRFKGRQFWFTCMIITMMLPSQVMMIPKFVLFNQLGWVGTYLPLTVPCFFGGGAFYIFLIMQFVRGVPRDMDEAARIDGCTWYGLYARIMLPMIVPALVTVGVLTFIGSWGDFMGALLYLNKPRQYTVAYALKLFNDNSTADYGATFAMSVLSLIPILLIFFFFQRNLVEGISMQGLKG